MCCRSEDFISLLPFCLEDQCSEAGARISELTDSAEGKWPPSSLNGLWETDEGASPMSIDLLLTSIVEVSDVVRGCVDVIASPDRCRCASDLYREV